MKAIKVSYGIGENQKTMIVLVDDEKNLEQAIMDKDATFKDNNPDGEINWKREIPLSNVLVSDLSVTELFRLLNHNCDKKWVNNQGGASDDKN